MRVYFGIPCYGGSIQAATMGAVMAARELLSRRGVQVELSFVVNESLIQRARNRLFTDFVEHGESDSVFQFIDADLSFKPEPLADQIVLASEEDSVIGGNYPTKSLYADKDNLSDMERTLVARGWRSPDTVRIVPIEGNAGAIRCVFVDGRTLVVAKYLPTGLMAFNHRVAMRVVSHLSRKKGGKYTNDGRVFHNAFQTPVVTTQKGESALLSEDYGFCRLAAEAGIQSLHNPAMQADHIGTYVFKGRG
jgi:hypothetical protein